MLLLGTALTFYFAAIKLSKYKESKEGTYIKYRKMKERDKLMNGKKKGTKYTVIKRRKYKEIKRKSRRKRRETKMGKFKEKRKCVMQKNLEETRKKT